MCIISQSRRIDREGYEKTRIFPSAVPEMIDFLVYGIAWLLFGCGIAWIIGGASDRDDGSGADIAPTNRRLHRRR